MMAQESTTIPTTDTYHNPTQITADYSNNNSDTSPDSLDDVLEGNNDEGDDSNPSDEDSKNSSE